MALRRKVLKKNACPLSNRIEIFKNLTLDEFTHSLDMKLFGGILEDHYSEFVEFCDKIKGNEKTPKSISCFLEDDAIHFVIES